METLGALVQVLLIVALVGGPALLAHWGRKNPPAEISLIVIVLFFSVLVIAVGGLVALVGFSGNVSASTLPPGLSASAATVLAGAGIVGIALCVPPLLAVTRRPTRGSDAAGSFETGGTETRRSGRFWSDPVTFLALWMFVVVLASNMVFLLAFVFAPEAVSTMFTSAGKLSPVAVVANQIPFFAIALLGVGIGVRRDLRQTLTRLGYGPVTLPQIGIAALFVAGALILSFASDYVFSMLQPQLYERVGDISSGLLGTQGQSLPSVIFLGLLVGLGAAFGEETLFRGAVQPVLGIILTSVLFASMHVQYGPSVSLVFVFVLSVGFGLLRRKFNTTLTFIAHAAYNFCAVLVAYLSGF